MADKKNIMTIDPTHAIRRMLHYKEKESSWEVYKALYWGIYVFMLGVCCS